MFKKHPLVDKRTTWQSQDDVIEKERQPIKRGGEQNGGAYVCTQIHFVPGALLACFSLYLFKNSHNKAMARCYYPHRAHQGGYWLQITELRIWTQDYLHSELKFLTTSYSEYMIFV